MKQTDGEYQKMINIEIPYTYIKGKQLDFIWNGELLMAWLLVIENDDVVRLWEFRFEEI